MKKQILLITVFICLANFINAQTSTSLLVNKMSVVNNDKNFPIPVDSKSETQTITLTVTCLTNRTQPLGGSFKHKVKLMNGTSPIANADVKINDPISRVCTLVTTNSVGEATWILPIPLDAKPECYAIEFFYGNVKCYSSVSVLIPSGAVELPSYTVNLNSAATLDDQTLAIASRGGFTSTKQPMITTLKAGVKLGLAIVKII